MENRPPAHRASGSERRDRFSIRSCGLRLKNQIIQTEIFLSVGISPTDKTFFSLCPLWLCGEDNILCFFNKLIFLTVAGPLSRKRGQPSRRWTSFFPPFDFGDTSPAVSEYLRHRAPHFDRYKEELMQQHRVSLPYILRSD